MAKCNWPEVMSTHLIKHLTQACWSLKTVSIKKHEYTKRRSNKNTLLSSKSLMRCQNNLTCQIQTVKEKEQAASVYWNQLHQPSLHWSLIVWHHPSLNHLADLLKKIWRHFPPLHATKAESKRKIETESAHHALLANHQYQVSLASCHKFSLEPNKDTTTKIQNLI